MAKVNSDIGLLSNNVVEDAKVRSTKRVEIGLTTELGSGIITIISVAAGVGNTAI